MASEAGGDGKGQSYWGMTARECDSCRASPATLFCRADSAFLCSACDSRVHSANKLASRHERVWLCEVCEQAPAAVTCKADAAALCLSCDADIHSANPLARRHERCPVVPFSASSPPFLPPKPLHDDSLLAPWLVPKPSPDADADADSYLLPDPDADYSNPFAVPDAGYGLLNFPSSKQHLPPSSFYASSLSHSVSSSDVGVVPDGGGMAEISNACVTGVPVNLPAVAAATAGMDREARVMRYREKRKNRKFQKTIRYASRKAYAETRPRVKGRFAKRTESDCEAVIGPDLYPATALFAESGYGVVPSF